MRNETPLVAAGLLVAILLGWPATGTLGAQGGAINLPDVLNDPALVPVVLPAAASGRPFVFECPASLDASSKVTAMPKGRIPVSGETPFPFDNITIFYGNPKDRVSMVPDRDLEETKDGKTGVSEWQFPGGAKNIWFTCSYRGTPSSLGVKVPNGMLRCRAISRRESLGWVHARKLVCEKPGKLTKRLSVNRLTREKSTKGNDFLIAPGLSLGKIRLGMRKKEVVALLGKPDNESNDSSMVYASKNGNETEIFLFKDKAIQISFTSPVYATHEGINTENFAGEKFRHDFNRYRISWRFDNFKYSFTSGGLTFYNLNADSPDENAEYPIEFIGIVHTGGNPIKEPLYFKDEKNGGWKEWDGKTQ